MKLAISSEEISKKVKELGCDISANYPELTGDNPLVVISVLKGSFIFTADLIREINLPVIVDFIGLQSYGDSTKSSGVVKITQDLSTQITGKHVLIVEDIVDTGLTLNYLTTILQARNPASIKVCTLLYKKAKSLSKKEPDYVAFVVDDLFFIGYGLDLKQVNRNLTGIWQIDSDDISDTKQDFWTALDQSYQTADFILSNKR